MEKKYSTVSEVARYLRVNSKTVYRMLEDGRLPARKIGHQWRIDMSELDEWTQRTTNNEEPACLVIDDEPNIGLLFKATLTEITRNVTCVTNGREGLDLIQQRSFDIVFIDLKLPGIDGVEVFRQIKRLKPETRVVIITGYPEGDLIEKALSYGPLHIMHKPFSIDEIQEVFRLFIRVNK